MNKKLSILMAAMMLTATMGVSAFAEDAKDPGRGEAGITFEKGGTEIVDPGDLDGVHTTDIHFGKWEVTQAAKQYDSLDNNMTVDTQYAGFAVFHSDKEAGWEVKVAISAFEIEDVGPTMGGYTLDLKKTATIYGDDDINEGPAPEAKDVRIFAADNGGLGVEELIFSAAKGNYGLYGANWSGLLDVPAGAAMQTGEAQAVMKWTVEKAA